MSNVDTPLLDKLELYLEGEVPDKPKLDIHSLPPLLKNLCTEGADALNVHPEMILVPSLISISAVIGNRVVIRPSMKGSWRIVPNLWGIVSAPPGSRKSASAKLALDALVKLDSKYEKEFKNSMSEAKADLYLLNEELDLLKKKKVDGADNRERRQEMIFKEKEISELTPLRKRFFVRDATTEKVIELLEENPNGLLLSRDEIFGVFDSLRKKGRENDRTFLLEAWNGDGSYSKDTKSGGSISIPELTLSFFGGTQPNKLKHLFDNTLKDPRNDDGFLQRFQLLVDVSMPRATKNKHLSTDDISNEMYLFLSRIEAEIESYCDFNEWEF